MSAIVIWIIIGISIIFGILDYYAWRHENGKVWVLLDIWRRSISFFVALYLGFLFVTIRLPLISRDGAFLNSDYVLLVVFLLGITGWLAFFPGRIIDALSKYVSDWIGKK